MESSTFERARRRAIEARVARTLVAVALGALAASPPALAEAPRSNEAARSAARSKLVEGVEALRRGEDQLALDRFQEAYALVPSPKIHYDFGLAYLGLGRRAEALSAFERFLSEAQDAPADKRDRATLQVEALRAELGSRAGGGPVVAANVPATTAPPPPPSAPLALAAPSAGQAPTAAASWQVSPGPIERPARNRRIAALSLGAAGLVLIGAGVTFGLLAQGESDSVSRDSANGASPHMATPFDPDKESRGIAYETVQVIGLVTGAVALAAGIVLYATTRGRVTVEPLAVHF